MKYIFIVLVFLLSACNDADVASRNLSKAADNFEVNRRIVFYNGITNDYMLVIEGLCSKDNTSTDHTLGIVCEVGPNSYKKHLLGLSDNVTFSGLASGTMTATQAMQNFANVILNEAIGSLVQMGMQYVKNAIVEQSTPAATTVEQVTEAAVGSSSYMTALGTMKAFSIAGARKNGGTVDAGSMYRVGEGGKPEILMQGGQQYLIPGENGQVLSNRQITSGNANIQWSFVVENYASNVEVSQPSIDVENRIIRMAVKQAKQEVAGDIKSFR